MKNLRLPFLFILLALATTLVFHWTQQARINYYSGRKFFTRGQYEQALPFFRRAYRDLPASFEIIRDLAFTLQWTGHSPDSIPLLEKALALKPGDAGLKEGLADAYAWNQRYDESALLYMELAQKDHGAGLMRKMGEVYIASGEFKKAQEFLKKALESSPGDKRTQLLLARALHYAGDHEGAIRICRELLERVND
jgi:tetratricopeptide (TPR) repeat protein